MNTFRHWFMWSAIEVTPGNYDWADYDKMMDLAAQNNIKVIIAEIDTAAPEWAFRKYASARYKGSDDYRPRLQCIRGRWDCIARGMVRIA